LPSNEGSTFETTPETTPVCAFFFSNFDPNPDNLSIISMINMMKLATP
jgi:hypothetical protein